MSETRTPLPHPLCVHLCSKKLYMLDAERELVVEDLQTAGYDNFWCRHTSTDTARDGGWVLYERCAPGRACYEPVERSLGLGFRVRAEMPPRPDDWAETPVLAEAPPPAEDLKQLSFSELLSRRNPPQS